MMTSFEKLGQCLRFICAMHEARLKIERPKAHAWHVVRADMHLGACDDGKLHLEIAVVEMNVRTNKVSKEDSLYVAEGDDAETMARMALGVLEGAINTFVTAERARRGKAQTLIAEGKDGAMLGIPLPPNTFVPGMLFGQLKQPGLWN